MKHVLILMLGMLFAFPAFSNEEMESRKWNKGPWELSEYKKRATGEFTHCGMSTDFTAPNKEAADRMKSRELSMILKINHDTSFNFILMGYDWTLNKGKKYNIRSEYDTGKIYNIDAYSDKLVGKFLDVNFPADGEWTENFMKAGAVKFWIDGTYIGSFYLKGSRDAMTEMLNCFAKNAPTPTFGSGKEPPTFGEGETPPTFGEGR